MAHLVFLLRRNGPHAASDGSTQCQQDAAVSVGHEGPSVEVTVHGAVAEHPQDAPCLHVPKADREGCFNRQARIRICICVRTNICKDPIVEGCVYILILPGRVCVHQAR